MKEDDEAKSKLRIVECYFEERFEFFPRSASVRPLADWTGRKSGGGVSGHAKNSTPILLTTSQISSSPDPRQRTLLIVIILYMCMYYLVLMFMLCM